MQRSGAYDRIRLKFGWLQESEYKHVLLKNGCTNTLKVWKNAKLQERTRFIFEKNMITQVKQKE